MKKKIYKVIACALAGSLLLAGCGLTDPGPPGALALGQEFARLSGYALAETPYVSGFAGYKDWFIKTWRRPGFTIEAGKGENPLPLSQFEPIYNACLGILTTAALGLPED